MQYNCSWIGIGVELPPLLTQQCGSVNAAISQINPASHKFSDTNRPHLNLYDLDVPESNISEITSALINALKDIPSFEVKIKNISYFHFGAVFFEIEKHPSLLDLHNTVVSTVYKYRGSCLCKDYLQPWRKYTQEQEGMLKEFGNPFVMNEFHPHISLGFIKASEGVLKNYVEDLRKIISITSFRVEKLSLVGDVKNGHNTLVILNLK